MNPNNDNLDHPCTKYNCQDCCRETQLSLTNDEINTIVNAGFSKSYFVKEDEYGLMRLKWNSNNYCIFSVGGRCAVNHCKPVGCVVYPLILDVRNREAILHSERCPHTDEFAEWLDDKDKEQAMWIRFHAIENERKARYMLRHGLEPDDPLLSHLPSKF